MEKNIEVREVLDYAKNNYMQIPSIIDVMNDLNKTHLLGSKYKLISISSSSIDRAVAKRIEDTIYLEIETERIKGIPAICCANEFPDIEIEWNEWLVYSILKKWSRRLHVCTTSNRYTEAIPVVYRGNKPEEDELEDIAIICKNRHLQVADNMDNIDELMEDMFDDIEF